SDVSDVDFHLVKGTRVSGKVVDALGAPIANASVNGSSGSSYDFASTAPDGTYTLDSLPLGTVNLSVYANGFVSQSRSINLTEDMTDVNFTLVKGTRVSGKVVDASNAAIPNASVSGSSGSSYDSATTGADGTYTLDSLPVGGVNLNVSAEGFLTQSRLLNV